MDFKRKALGLAMSAVAAVAVGVTAVPASAMDNGSDAYYAADGGRAHQSRADRRAARSENKHRKSTGDYSRDVERSRGDNSVGRTTTITNDETGNAITRERTTSRDTETGAITHNDSITGPEGEKTLSTSTTATKNDDGRTVSKTVTTPNGTDHTHTVDVSKDPESQSVTKTVTNTNDAGDSRTRDTTVTRTDDGYTRSTDFNGGGETDVSMTKDPETGKWQREVTRTPSDGADEPNADTTVGANADDQVEPPSKN
jgi:hypothetical protein